MLKAVIFDDEYIVLQGLRQMIDWSRYGVELAGTAEDGVSALQLLRACKPDIVLTDIRMPGMDGLQLIETAAAESPETMFIVFSGFNEFEYVRRAIGLGVIDYLEKPVTVSKIEAALRRTMNRIGKEQAFGEMKKKLEAICWRKRRLTCFWPENGRKANGRTYTARTGRTWRASPCSRFQRNVRPCPNILPTASSA